MITCNIPNCKNKPARGASVCRKHTKHGRKSDPAKRYKPTTFKEHIKESRMERRNAACDKAREYVEDLAKELANEHDNYETFLGHMKKLIPQMDPGPGGTVILPNETGPIHMDLKWMWERHNEVKHQEFKDAWDDYGRARAEGKYASKDGWTGD